MALSARMTLSARLRRVLMTSRCSSSSHDFPSHRYRDRTRVMLTQATRFFSRRRCARSAERDGGTVEYMTQISTGGAPAASFFSMAMSLSLPADKRDSSPRLRQEDKNQHSGLNSIEYSANSKYLCTQAA